MIWTLALAGIAFASDWAVLVSTSNSWYDYRHSSNVLAIHQQLRSRGVPESNIVLLNAGQHQCNPRNLYTGKQMVTPTQEVPSVRADYVGRHVTLETLQSVLMNSGLGKTLGSDENSKVLLYLTGHGSDGMLAFQGEPLDVRFLSEMLNRMWRLKRYKEMLLVVDSCQSATMLEVDAPKVRGLASAARGQPSWSRRRNDEMGISLIDEFTSGLVNGVEGVGAPAHKQARLDLQTFLESPKVVLT